MTQISTQQNVTLPNSVSAVIVEAAADRVLLIVNAPVSNQITISTSSAAVDDQGIVIFSAAMPLILTRATHGELVTRGWTAIYAGTSVSVTVTSVYEH
ncbi:MAG: hypothetical protein HY791_24555 [Deltaproteobacteria bacterium]|nr:hypothetical protein [Deltaproteobacteria bacterium]